MATGICICGLIYKVSKEKGTSYKLFHWLLRKEGKSRAVLTFLISHCARMMPEIKRREWDQEYHIQKYDKDKSD